MPGTLPGTPSLHPPAVAPGVTCARIAGALWHVHVDAAQRYAGLLTAAAKHEELTEQHDEDWYRNPRAVDQLRAETRLPPATTVSDADLDRGRAALRRLLAPGFD